MFTLKYESCRIPIFQLLKSNNEILIHYGWEKKKKKKKINVLLLASSCDFFQIFAVSSLCLPSESRFSRSCIYKYLFIMYFLLISL